MFGPVDFVFNGQDDDTLKTVRLPLAFVRFLLSQSYDFVKWQDASYQPTEITSLQLSAIETGVKQLIKDETMLYNLIGLGAAMPGLKGLWLGQPGISGAPDMSGNGFTLIPGGAYNPDFHEFNGAPIAICDSQAYLSHNSDNLSILGTEERYSPGLTILSWLKNTTFSEEHSLCVRQAISTNGWTLRRASDQTYRFSVNNVEVVGESDSGEWTFLAATWKPAVSLKIQVDDTTDENTTSIPASMTASTANLILAKPVSRSPTTTTTWSTFVLSSMAVDQSTIDTYHEATREIFGV